MAWAKQPQANKPNAHVPQADSCTITHSPTVFTHRVSEDTQQAKADTILQGFKDPRKVSF